VTDVRRALTPELRAEGDVGYTELLLIDLGGGQNRLGASCLAQVYEQVGAAPPDVDDPRKLSGFFAAVQELAGAGALLAYHDRSDGGLFMTLLEMAFAGGAGVELDLGAVAGPAALAALFSEELGAVVQVRAGDVARVTETFARHGLAGAVSRVARLAATSRFTIRAGGRVVFDEERATLRGVWSETTHAIQRMRDDAGSADEEQQGRTDAADPGRSAVLTFALDEIPGASRLSVTPRPRVAILREQGVNGQIEMAAAFDRAGFEAVDVHMTDVLSGSIDLGDFRGIAACGGFSYGDVLGAGEGWAKSILFNGRAREAFSRFFARPDSFTLGVCNGCQMVSNLKELIPGAARWPRFVRNRSEQFEARLAMVSIEKSDSIFFKGMEGSRLPIAVAHGEGRAEFAADGDREALERELAVAARFVDHRGRPTQHYPENPNGSPGGITALTAAGGRVMIVMPHPERVFRTVQLSWHPREWGNVEDSPWMRMFRNVRAWVG
jgi:phosphoribosylformylglycinamidine synthase